MEDRYISTVINMYHIFAKIRKNIVLGTTKDVQSSRPPSGICHWLHARVEQADGQTDRLTEDTNA